MTDILLAKPKLPPDFIDVSVGEPHLIKDNLVKVFNLNNALMSLDIQEMTYPCSTGYQPLVKYLEAKHQAPVIITNGAKQALGAVFYALAQMNKTKLNMRLPYWALIPPLARMHGIDCVYNSEGQAELCLAPNNPDGFVPDLEQLSKSCQEKNIPLIHDAAYYTHIYLSRKVKLTTIGDVQIFSISKMLGLSGLRLGYAVCPNPVFYKYIKEYMEAMTVGVSIASQKFLYYLMTNIMEPQPHQVRGFEDMSANELEDNKRMLLRLDSEVLEIPNNIKDIPGMFGWFKLGSKADFNKAKIHAISGDLFGMPGYVRMNLAFNKHTMREIVDRLDKLST